MNNLRSLHMYKILLACKHQEQDGTSIINDMYSKQKWRYHLKSATAFEHTILWILPALASQDFFQEQCTMDVTYGGEHLKETRVSYKYMGSAGGTGIYHTWIGLQQHIISIFLSLVPQAIPLRGVYAPSNQFLQLGIVRPRARVVKLLEQP